MVFVKSYFPQRRRGSAMSSQSLYWVLVKWELSSDKRRIVFLLRDIGIHRRSLCLSNDLYIKLTCTLINYNVIVSTRRITRQFHVLVSMCHVRWRAKRSIYCCLLPPFHSYGGDVVSRNWSLSRWEFMRQKAMPFWIFRLINIRLAGAGNVTHYWPRITYFKHQDFWNLPFDSPQDRWTFILLRHNVAITITLKTVKNFNITILCQRTEFKLIRRWYNTLDWRTGWVMTWWNHTKMGTKR